MFGAFIVWKKYSTLHGVDRYRLFSNQRSDSIVFGNNTYHHIIIIIIIIMFCSYSWPGQYAL